ncbi:MAG: CvpA family protein [Edaphocola sp.]
MILDVLFLIVLVLSSIKGYKRGLVIALFSAIGLVLGFLASFKLSATVGNLLFDSKSFWGRWAPVFSYALLFLLVVWAVKVLASLIQNNMERLRLGSLNRLAGALLYGLLVCVVGSVFCWLLGRAGLFAANTQSNSIAYSYLSPWAPKVFDFFGAVFPFVKSSYNDLSQFFDSINERAAHLDR